VDVTASPIFLLTVPERNPRTECGCQPVAFINSLAVTPPGRFSKSRTLAVLLPSRADLAFFWPLGAFFGGLAFLADLAFFGGTWARCRATLAFLLGFGWSPVAVAWAVPVSSAIEVFTLSPLAVITAGHHMDHSGRTELQGKSATRRSRVFPAYKKMPGGRKKYDPTEKDYRIVEAMAGCGMPHESIARALGIDPKTLRKHFRRELDSSADKANAQVGATLFKLATSSNCPAATIFWMKCRLRWRETTRLEHSGPDGRALLPIEAARALLESAAASRPAEDSDEKPIKE
jgi:hypothetical protein